MPLIVHTREADSETAGIIGEEAGKGPLNGVIHCFTSGRQLAEKAIDLGFYLFFFSSSSRHTRATRDWSSDVCSSDLATPPLPGRGPSCRPSSAPVARASG